MTTSTQKLTYEESGPTADAASTEPSIVHAVEQDQVGARNSVCATAVASTSFAYVASKENAMQPDDEFIDEMRRLDASEVRRHVSARLPAPAGAAKSKDVQTNLGSLSQVGIIPLGRYGHDRFAFWRIDHESIEILGANELGKHQGLQRLADANAWEDWCGGKELFKLPMASNALIGACMSIGDVDLGLVPASHCMPAAVVLAWVKACVRLPGGATPGKLAEMLLSMPEWQLALHFDELTQSASCDIPLPCGGPAGHLTDEHDGLLCAYLEKFHVLVSPNRLQELILLMAMRNRRHPVQEYLKSQSWDGTPRLDDVLIRLAGADDTPFARLVFAKTLIGACARAFRPGCKVDTALVLEGEQGATKSAFLRALMPKAEWFAEGLGAQIGQKDAVEGLIGKMMIELPELSALKSSAIDTVKEFMTKQTDRIRLPYARRSRDFPRACIFVGTVNPDADGTYLRDDTGNRRFWPISVKKCDIEGLTAELGQLWAEAYVRYLEGEPHWLDEAGEQLAKAEQAARLQPNPWRNTVLDYIDNHKHRKSFTVGEVFDSAQGRKPTARDVIDQKKIAAVFKSLGWIQKDREDGRRAWHAPTLAVPEEGEGKPL